MNRARIVVAMILFVFGVIWIAQGVGLLGGSAMSGQSPWAVVGAVLVAAAGVVAWTARRAPRG